MVGFYYFRSDKIWGIYDVGRIFFRDNQVVYVNDVGMFYFWIDKYVFIVQIVVIEICCMYFFDGFCQQQIDFEIGKCIVLFMWVEKFILVVGVGKLFVFFFMVFYVKKIIVFRVVFKEKVVFVGWNYDVDFIFMFNNVGWLVKQVFLVFIFGLIKNVLFVVFGDYINLILGLFVLWFMIKSDDV